MVKLQPAVSCEDCPSKKLNVLCSVKQELAAAFNKGKQVRSWGRREMLFYEGAQATGAFCVRSGKVKLFKVGSEGKPLIFKIACAGDVLALESVFHGQHFHYSAQTLEESEICWIDRAFVIEIFQSDLNAALKLTHKLAADLVQCQESHLEMAQLTVRERLARLLLALAEAHGADSGRGRQIALSLSREELSEMVGTAPETVMRLLKDFREEKMIDVSRRQITLVNRSGLSRAGRVKAAPNPS